VSGKMAREAAKKKLFFRRRLFNLVGTISAHAL